MPAAVLVQYAVLRIPGGRGRRPAGRRPGSAHRRPVVILSCTSEWYGCTHILIDAFVKACARRAVELALVMEQDAGRGWWRMGASPHPQEIIERESILRLLDQEFVVIGQVGDADTQLSAAVVG